MTWQHLKTFLWVRGRILRNQAKRNSFDSLLLQGALIVIPGIAGVVMFVAFFGVGLFVLQDVSPAVLMLVWDGLLGAFLLFWMIGLLTELQRSELLSIEKFLRLPVPPRSVFLINYLGSIVLTPCMVVFLPAMVGLATGLVISRGSLMLGLFPLILAFIVLVTAITYQFQGWLAALMVNKRRRRNIIAVSTVGFVLVLQLPYLVGLFAESRSEPPSAEIADMREERRALRIQIAALTQAADEEESGEAERIAVLASLRTYRGRVEVLTQSIDALSEAADEEAFKQVERIAGLANRVIPLGWLPYGAMTLAPEPSRTVSRGDRGTDAGGVGQPRAFLSHDPTAVHRRHGCHGPQDGKAGCASICASIGAPCFPDIVDAARAAASVGLRTWGCHYTGVFPVSDTRARSEDDASDACVDGCDLGSIRVSQRYFGAFRGFS